MSSEPEARLQLSVSGKVGSSVLRIFLTGGAFTQRARDFVDGVPNTVIDKPFQVANILAILERVPRR